MVSDAVKRNPLFYFSISFYIEMPTVPGSALRVMDAFTIGPGRRQVRKFRAMDNYKVYMLDGPRFQARGVGKKSLENSRVVQGVSSLSGFVFGTGADCIAVLKMHKAVGIGNRQGLIPVVANQLLTVPTAINRVRGAG